MSRRHMLPNFAAGARFVTPAIYERAQTAVNI
jgi:hypothetical protein